MHQSSQNLPACLRLLGVLAVMLLFGLGKAMPVTAVARPADMATVPRLSDLHVAEPTIELDISPPLQLLDVGATAGFTVTLTNPGPDVLYDITIAADSVPGCSRPSPFDLPARNFVRYTCSQPDTTADLSNMVVANGCAVDATPCPADQMVSAAATALVDVIAPAIAVDIDPAATTVLHGSSVTWTVTVTNSGNIPLDHVGVVDVELPACALPVVAERRLDPGARLIYDCSADGLTSDLSHTLKAEGSPPSGRFVQASIEAAVDVLNPGLALSVAPAVSIVERHAPVALAVEVGNVGDAPLKDLYVESSDAPDCARPLADPLLPGETIGYGCSLIAGALDAVVVLTARGLTSIDTIAGAEATAQVDVRAPQLTLVKRAHESVVGVGRPVTFTIVVTNSGEAPLTQVTVVDPLLPTCNIEPPFDLPVGASHTHSCVMPQITAPITNTAAANATAADPFAGEIVSATAAVAVQTAVFSTIGDRVWDDLDGNGIQDVGEPGMSGVRVVAQGPSPGLLVESVTDQDGRYRFNRLLPGIYQLSFSPPAGYVATLQNQGLDDSADSDIEPHSGQITDLIVALDSTTTRIDAGFYLPPAVGDRVWYDSDADGVQESGEGGVANVVVRLVDERGTVAEVKTGPDGKYDMEGLRPGRYWLDVRLPGAGDRFSPLRAGDGLDDSAIDPQSGLSAPFVLLSGARLSDLDAGFFKLSLIQGTVVADPALDGNLASGGTGAPGLSTRLYARRGSAIPVLHSVTATDDEGRFVFTNVEGGDYVIHVEVPDGAALLELSATDVAGQFTAAPRLGAATDHFIVEPASIGETRRLALIGSGEASDHVLMFWPDERSDGIVLQWMVREDLAVHTYEIWRAASADRGQATLLSRAAITPGEHAIDGIEIHGLIDIDLTPGHDAYYWLEVVDSGGNRQVYGPLQAAMDSSGRAIQRLHLPVMMSSR